MTPVDQSFLDALHADKPLRVWSLIVTIFGDVVMRRGTELSPPPIWTGHLLTLLGMLGVEAGLVRTSLSRLVANGILLRDKHGRNTFYRLGEASRQEFAVAARQIYGSHRHQPTGQLHLALTDLVSDRASARAELEARGFRFLSATTALLPAIADNGSLPDIPDLMTTRVNAEGNFADAALKLWSVAALQTGYRDFLERFGQPLAPLRPETAILARIVAVHHMRRLILKDPMLPLTALPPDWAGEEARKLFSRLLAEWQEASEQWVEEMRLRG